MTDLLKQLKTGLMLLLFFSVLTGVIYPGVIALIAQLFFPVPANGSIILKNENPVGSLLIGQSFSNPKYFWGRPSATTPFPYNAANSRGSNLGPTNSELLMLIKKRVENLKNNAGYGLIPVDLVTASASGLDPDISPAAAYFQVPRIAKLRHIPEKDIIKLISKFTQKRTFGIIGEFRVNVLQLNLALDRKSYDR